MIYTWISVSEPQEVAPTCPTIFGLEAEVEFASTSI